MPCTPGKPSPSLQSRNAPYAHLAAARRSACHSTDPRHSRWPAPPSCCFPSGSCTYNCAPWRKSSPARPAEDEQRPRGETRDLRGHTIPASLPPYQSRRPIDCRTACAPLPRSPRGSPARVSIGRAHRRSTYGQPTIRGFGGAYLDCGAT